MSKGLKNFKVNLSITAPHTGKYCAEISSIGYSSVECGTISQSINAKPYRGKEITIKAFVRADVLADGWSSLFLRTRRTGDFFMYNQEGDLRITDNQWKEYSITKMVEDNAETIEFGCALFRAGTVYLDDLSFIGDDGGLIVDYEGPRPLSDHGMRNLTVFAKLFGYIRYFHPSDQAARVIWDNIAINAVRKTESAPNDLELVARLQSVFAPLAPTVQISLGKIPTELIQTDVPIEAKYIRVWKHMGVGMGNQPPHYTSKREQYSVSEISSNKDLSRMYNSKRIVYKQLADNIWASIPIFVFATSEETIPNIESEVRIDTLSDDFIPSGNDRVTRLADVIILWNVFQHFYTYFDVINIDWEKILASSLSNAATANNAMEFEHLMRSMGSTLNDGRNFIVNAGIWKDIKYAPYGVYIEGNTMVVSGVRPELNHAIHTGDIIDKVNDIETSAFLDRRRKLVSSSSPQFKDYMLSRSALGIYNNDSVKLTIRSRERDLRTVSIKTLNRGPFFESKRPPTISELEPNIYYVNLDMVRATEFNEEINKLADAKAIIFDMRGYPENIEFEPITHLIDTPVSIPPLLIPITRYPDREGVEWDTSNWKIEPSEPRFTKNIVHLMDRRVITKAESYMAIIDNFRIGEIVGSPSAGTMGQTNPFTLPGNYSVTWTGLKALKYDGSQHHGVGIKPTVFCKPTVEGIRNGRDEVLEKGIEVAKMMIEKNR